MFQGGRNLLITKWLNKQSAANNNDESCISSSLVPNTQRNKPEIKRKNYMTNEQKHFLEWYFNKVTVNPSTEQVANLSEHIDRAPKSISNWFINRRSNKGIHKPNRFTDEPCTSSSLVPSTKKKTCKYERFTDEQLKGLEMYYDKTKKKPNYEEIGELSKKLGTNKIRTWTWFEKKNSKNRKQEEDQNLAGSQPSNIESKKDRRIRPNYTQKQRLKSIVEKGIFPSPEEIEDISKEIDFDEIRIFNWLRNHKFNNKKKVPSAKNDTSSTLLVDEPSQPSCSYQQSSILDTTNDRNNLQAHKDTTFSFPEINPTFHEKRDHWKKRILNACGFPRQGQQHQAIYQQGNMYQPSYPQGQPSSSHQQRDWLVNRPDQEYNNTDVQAPLQALQAMCDRIDN